jgi:hypothetical protein
MYKLTMHGQKWLAWKRYAKEWPASYYRTTEINPNPTHQDISLQTKVLS